VEIETAGGHKMRLDDMKKSVSISSTGTMKITAQTQIEISAPNIKVTGKAVVDVKGGVIKLN
jgi:phage gp45-like